MMRCESLEITVSEREYFLHFLSRQSDYRLVVFSYLLLLLLLFSSSQRNLFILLVLVEIAIIVVGV